MKALKRTIGVLILFVVAFVLTCYKDFEEYGVLIPLLGFTFTCVIAIGLAFLLVFLFDL